MPRTAGFIDRTTAGRIGSAFRMTSARGSAVGTSAKLSWIPETRTWFICQTPRPTSRAMVGKHLRRSGERQQTGQFYHVAKDNRFPYWVYGPQQDSGAAATQSRSNYRSLNFHD